MNVPQFVDLLLDGHLSDFQSLVALQIKQLQISASNSYFSKRNTLFLQELLFLCYVARLLSFCKKSAQVFSDVAVSFYVLEAMHSNSFCTIART